MATILDGFTPCPDEIVVNYGLHVAAVWGKISRYEQMEDRACYAAQARIGAELGLSRKTVNKHLKVLLGAGYIRVKEGINGMPNTYNTTNKVVMKLSADSGAGKNLDRGWEISTQVPGKKGYTKKESKKENNKKPFPYGNKTLTPEQQQMAEREQRARDRMMGRK